MSLRRYGRQKKPPPGYEYIEPILEALETEMREAVNEPHEGKRKCEALWPVHQINWQRSRYIFDVYYKYKKISRALYDWCCRMKLCDAALAAKWKKPGFDRLCSVHCINTRNTNYGTTSICRVPRKCLAPDTVVQDQLTGCRGCASGPGGYNNIFGNKYGQYLAGIQVAREEAAKKKGKVYIARKEWTYAMDFDEVRTSKKDAQTTARKTSKKALDEQSWLGGDEKKKKKKKRTHEEAAAPEAVADGDGDTSNATAKRVKNVLDAIETGK